jgi:hypothetical protein
MFCVISLRNFARGQDSRKPHLLFPFGGRAVLEGLVSPGNLQTCERAIEILNARNRLLCVKGHELDVPCQNMDGRALLGGDFVGLVFSVKYSYTNKKKPRIPK